MPQPETHRPLITAAICTYSRYDLLAKCIASCRAQSLAMGAFRIIVVDNSPDPARAAEAAAEHAGPGLRYLIEAAPGLSNARNIAARACRTPYIAYIDDDAIAEPGWLAGVLEAFGTDPAGAGVVGGPVRPIWPQSPPAWLPQERHPMLSIIDWGGEAPRVAVPDEWFAGANMAFRTPLIAAAGYFDVRLGRTGASGLLSNEDKDLISRIEALGWSRVYAPGASVDHLVPPSRLHQGWFRSRTAWQAASELLSDPEGTADWMAVHTRRILYEFYEGGREPEALFRDMDDSHSFLLQLNAIYAQTLLSLSGADANALPSNSQVSGQDALSG